MAALFSHFWQVQASEQTFLQFHNVGEIKIFSKKSFITLTTGWKREGEEKQAFKSDEIGLKGNSWMIENGQGGTASPQTGNCLTLVCLIFANKLNRILNIVLVSIQCFSKKKEDIVVGCHFNFFKSDKFSVEVFLPTKALPSFRWKPAEEKP